jgi:antitoxin ChpS
MTTLRKAGGSVMVTVPPVFLKKHGLGAGSAVSVEIKGDELRVRPAAKKVTLTEILRQAPKNARGLRAAGWDELDPVGNEK